MGDLPMQFEEFKRLALIKLLGNQLDNGSWLNDLVVTIAAIEALCEEFGGPDPVCKFSALHNSLRQSSGLPPDPESRPEPLGFSWGPPAESNGSNAEYLAALYRAMSFGYPEVRQLLPEVRPLLLDEPIDDGRAWILAKWYRVDALTDRDFSLQLWGQLANCSPAQPWLLAQVGQAELHDAYYSDHSSARDVADRPDVIDRVKSLLLQKEIDHWRGGAITDEEATSIVGAYLFHECTRFVCSKSSDVDSTLNSAMQDVLSWVIRQQGPSGGWANSPHVTAHALRLLDYAFAERQPEMLKHSCLDAIHRGIDYLLSSETQSQWTPLLAYQHYDILATLIRLAKRTTLRDMIHSGREIDGSALRPDVFISYGGPDADFAKRLASDLEASGVRVWFAEWDLDYGEDVVQEIEKGIDSTKSFLIVMSPEAISRPWVKKELSSAFRQALDGPGKLILPLMYRRCQPPLFLAANRWIDFTDEGTYSHQVKDLARRLKGRRPSRT
jgi:hypothetical protein